MVTYLYILHCMDFSVNSQWWGEGEMMRPSVQGVDPPVCCTPGCYCYICKRQLCGFPQCAASWMTYARDSFVDSQGGLLSSRGGDVDTLAQTHWHQSYNYYLCAKERRNCEWIYWEILSVSCNLQWNCWWPWKCAGWQGTPGSYLVRWPCSRIQKSFTILRSNLV